MFERALTRFCGEALSSVSPAEGARDRPGARRHPPAALRPAGSRLSGVALLLKPLGKDEVEEESREADAECVASVCSYTALVGPAAGAAGPSSTGASRWPSSRPSCSSRPCAPATARTTTRPVVRLRGRRRQPSRRLSGRPEGGSEKYVYGYGPGLKGPEQSSSSDGTLRLSRADPRLAQAHRQWSQQ